MSGRRSKKANAGKKTTKKGRAVKKTRVKDLDLGELEGRKVRGGLLRGPRAKRLRFARPGFERRPFVIRDGTSNT